MKSLRQTFLAAASSMDRRRQAAATGPNEKDTRRRQLRQLKSLSGSLCPSQLSHLASRRRLRELERVRRPPAVRAGHPKRERVQPSPCFARFDPLAACNKVLFKVLLRRALQRTVDARVPCSISKQN